MPITDADWQALQDRVAALEKDGTGGWAGFINGAWKKVEPYVTPILIAASAAIVLWIQTLNHSTTTAAIAAVKDQSAANAVVATEAKVAADKAADQSKENANLLMSTHEEVKSGIEGVKKDIAKPRPLFPGKE